MLSLLSNFYLICVLQTVWVTDLFFRSGIVCLSISTSYCIAKSQQWVNFRNLYTCYRARVKMLRFIWNITSSSDSHIMQRDKKQSWHISVRTENLHRVCRHEHGWFSIFDEDSKLCDVTILDLMTRERERVFNISLFRSTVLFQKNNIYQIHSRTIFWSLMNGEPFFYTPYRRWFKTGENGSIVSEEDSESICSIVRTDQFCKDYFSMTCFIKDEELKNICLWLSSCIYK